MRGHMRSLALLASSLLFTGAVQANNFNYNYFDFLIGSGPTTLGVGLSTQYTENSHFIGVLESEFEGDWDLAGGMGFNGPAGQFADIYGRMMLHIINEKGGSNTFDEDFLPEFAVGGRVWLFDGVEAYADLGQVIDGDETHSIFNVGGRFHSTQQLVIGGGLRKHANYGSQVFMQVRFQY